MLLFIILRERKTRLNFYINLEYWKKLYIHIFAFF